jgi:TM2 domain-containing membrane protein YozV
MSNWYLLRNNATNGPYPEEQVREWIKTGQLLPEEQLCREGDTTWAAASMTADFAADFPAAPVVAPGATPFVPATVAAPGAPAAAGLKDRTVAGILAILLGGLGIHHFYLGNTTMGIIYILLACVGVSPILGLVDGIIYLTKPDDVFQRNYQNWFCGGV